MFDNINRQINPMAFHELQRFYPEAYKKFREMLLQTDVAILSDNMKRGMAEGIYRSGLNTDILARYRLETSMLVLQPNLIVNERNDLLTVALEIGEHFLYGIITPKGEQLYCQYKQQYLNK